MPPPPPRRPRPPIWRRVSRTLRALWALHGEAGMLAFLRAFAREVMLALQRRRDRSYWRWSLLYNTPSPGDLNQLRRRAAGLDSPVFGLLMEVGTIAAPRLHQTLASLRAQTWPHWRLCIATPATVPDELQGLLEHWQQGDARIRLLPAAATPGECEASGTLLAQAGSSHFALLAAGDLLAPFALQAVAEELRAHPQAMLVYTDEDLVDEQGRRLDPHFKPDASPELLLAFDYVGRLAVYPLALLRTLDRASDHDLALRVFEQALPANIRHLPLVCYHRQQPTGATSTEAGRRALTGHLERSTAGGAVEVQEDGRYRVRFALPAERPTVSVVIPTRDQLGLLRMAISGLLEHTAYAPLQVIVVDNQSEHPDTLAYLETIARDPRVRVVRHDASFNYPLVNAAGIDAADGELLLLLNNDIEVLHPDWLEEMVGLVLRPGVGAVGARLLYPDRSVQHAGVVLDTFGVGAHVYKYCPAEEAGYMRRAVSVQNLSALTAACLLLRREVYDAVGGLDPALRVAFNDVDLCLRIRQAGWRLVYTPHATLVHHESKSRGSDYTTERLHEFRAEQALMRERWQQVLDTDPCFSPNLVLEDERPQLAFPPRVARPWE